MTCIVAIVDTDGTAYFAGDALVVQVPSEFHSGVSQTIRREPKVWARNGIGFGANGEVRMLQLVRYVLEIPEYTSDQNKIRYLVTKFIPAMQDCFLNNEYSPDKLHGNILMSLEGELFTIGERFDVCNTADPYDSVGKASEVAIGSLCTTAQLKLQPRERLLLALKAAQRHTCVVSEPFTFITNEMEEAEILAD